MKSKITMAAFVLLAVMSTAFMQCKKDSNSSLTPDVVTVDTGTVVPGAGKIDTSWTCDKPHCNVGWQSRYYDFSNTMLTGRFNDFQFAPKFVFNEADLSTFDMHFWVNLATFNTGEPGRDGLGKCGPSYLGVTYLDSAKTKVDSASIFARFDASGASSISRLGTGYVITGTFTFNRWRSPSGHADGTPITKTIQVYMTYNGMKDFDSNNDGVTDKFRAGCTATFSFNRSDFMDKNSTKQWVPTPTVGTTNLSAGDVTGNLTAANNKTYGVWSASVADEMSITVNGEFYKNH